MRWTDFLVPLLAVLTSLPPLTVAWLAGHKSKDPARRLFAGGLALVAAIIFLVSTGVFLDVAGVATATGATALAPIAGLKFLFWNLTFLLAFGSLLVLRHFITRVLPGPHRRPLLFWVLSAVFYAVTLVLAFGVTPPLIDFRSTTASVLGSLYYLGGITLPGWKMWRRRQVLPTWFSPTVELLVRILLPLGVLAALWEGLRFWNPAWPAVSAIPVVFFVFFALVGLELVRRFPMASASGSPMEKAERLAARFPAQNITAREKQVLSHLLEGHKNTEIAAVLGVSAHTVKNHIYNLYQKLGTDTRLELLALVMDSSPMDSSPTGSSETRAK
ncbi:MAG: helix-turn-helix transcriptional regulator [Spirochaetales bacterium]